MTVAPDRLKDNERGASAILVAATLLLLMGFSALAVDSGVAFGDRRQQQSAADVGALAAVQFAKTTLTAAHPDCGALLGIDRAACRGAEEALDVVSGTLAGRYSDADWDSCVDPSKPAEYTQQSFISDCISFTGNMRRARVVLPGTEVDTSFAAVLGFDSIAVGAFAEAGVEFDISGGVLPFAIGPSGAGVNQACFSANSTTNLTVDPCSGPTQGNFGKLNLRLYGNEDYGTPQICTGNTAQRMATNIITGTDHPLEIGSASPGTVDDVLNCPIITNPVDTVETWTGNASGAIGDGFFTGIATPALEGRLLCKDGDAGEDYPQFTYVSKGCVSVNTLHPESMDHTPLWSYIAPGANSEVVGGACAPGGGPVKNRIEMEACLAGWRAWGTHTTNLFRKELTDSPRFGAVPLLDSDPGSGHASYQLNGFLPIYLETIYFKCNANACTTVHSPGEASTGACPNPVTPTTTSCGWPDGGNQAVEAVTGFILTLDMLDPDVAENFPYQPGTITYNLHR